MPDATNTIQQVKFYKGSLATYNSNVSSYPGGVFFDTNNLDIYLDGYKYTEHRFSFILDDSSVVSVADVPYLIIDSSTNTSSNDYTTIKLPKVVGSDAIDTSLGQITGDFTISLKLNNQNDHSWLTQSSNGLQFNEDLLETFKINNKGILSNAWMTADDVSVGSIPAVSDSSLTIETTDSIAIAIQKLNRVARGIYIQDGSYIDISYPSSGDSDNGITISSTLHAGDNITIDSDGAINAEGGTYWNEID